MTREVDDEVIMLPEEEDGYDNDELEQLMGNKNYGYPTPPTKDSIFKFFRDILGLEDSSKAGNLESNEMGQLKLTVRHYQDLANFAKYRNLDIVNAYLKGKSEIILSTSLSRKGFLPQLFVTQIKKEQKMRKAEAQVKQGFFSPKPKVVEEE
jgi:hypothetical protein